MGMSLANRCHCSRELKGSARVSRVWRWCLAIANFSSAMQRSLNLMLRKVPFGATPKVRAGRAYHARRMHYPEPAHHLLRAFFEGAGFAAQMGERFAGEMQRAGDENRIRFCAGELECFAN
jgi:hypothetical protein